MHFQHRRQAQNARWNHAATLDIIHILQGNVSFPRETPLIHKSCSYLKPTYGTKMFSVHLFFCSWFQLFAVPVLLKQGEL